MKFSPHIAAKVRDRLLPITLSQATGLVCGLAGVKLATRLVPPADYGAYGIFMTFTPLGMWVVHAGVIKFVGRHWAGSGHHRALLGRVQRSMLRKAPWLALATAGAAWTMPDHRWLVVFPLLFVTAALLSWAALTQTALQAAREHWRDFAVSGTGSITRSFIPPLLYAMMGGSVAALYCGYGLHALALALAGTWALRKHWRSGPTGPTGEPGLMPVYEGPLFIAIAIAGWIMAGLHRWIVALAFGPEEAGYFTLATNLAALVPSILGVICMQLFQPGFFSMASEEPATRQRLAQRVDRVAMMHAALSLAGLGALRLVAPFLIGPLIRETYRPALGLLLPVGCATLAVATGWFYHSLLLAGQRERACGPVELSAAAIMVAGSVAAAAAGETWFLRWLILTPILPWLVNRSFARRHFFQPAENPAHPPG